MTLLLLLLLALPFGCSHDDPRDRASAPAGSTPAADAAEATVYACPMHPSVRQAEPGRCPLCGMDLVKIAADAPDSVTVDAETRTRFGIHTVLTEEKVLTRTVRFAGTVGWDLRRQRDVAVRTSGTVEGLRVTAGSPVRAGDALFSLRSPELAAAQADLLAGPAPDSARARLLAMGLTAAQVDGIVSRRAALSAVPVLAPVAGVVTSLEVVEGSPVGPGSAVARIADAGAVWIEANLSGADAAVLADGVAATVTVEGGAPVAGVVHPLASGDAVSRVRVDLPDGGGLRPGAVAVVEAPVASAPAVVVPVDAVVYAGTRRVVFVDDGTALVPREVELGARAGDEIIVTHGLAAGDRVVAQGAFLVAADSRLRAPAAWEQE